MKIRKNAGKLSIADRKEFTDRIEARETFWRLLDKGYQAQDEFFVLSCYGIAGSGKSRLLEEYKSMLDGDRENYVYASYDFENNASDAFQVIARLCRQLEKKGLAFPLTTAAELAYNEKSGIPVYQEVEEQDILDHPVLGVLGGFLPAVDEIVGTLKAGREAWRLLQHYKEKLSILWDPEKKELERELSRIWGQNDAERIRRFMPEYFRIDLYRNTQNLHGLGIVYPLVIFLDTFENCVNSYDKTGFAKGEDLWLRNDLINRIPGILWVIAGREKLGWKEKDASYSEMEECCLEEFSKTDALNYLSAAGIPEYLRQHMVDTCRGVPLLLDISVDSYYQQAHPSKIVEEEEIGFNQDELISRFVRYMNPKDQMIAVILSLLDHWQDEEARTVFPKVLGDSFNMGDYDSFLQHTIIRKDKEERYYIHQSVREVILAYANEAMFTDIVKKTRAIQAERLTLPKNAGYAEIVSVQKDMEDLKRQNTAGKELLEETEQKNHAFYERIRRIKGGGWGPSRTMYTMKQPSPVPSFNSILDNHVAGDERCFVRIATKGAGEEYTYIKKLHPFAFYELYILFDNSCTKKDATIQGARAQVFFPSEIQPWEIKKISALLSADNTEPKEVWGDVFSWCDTPLHLQYAKGSAVLHGGGKPLPLTNRLFRKEGQWIGMERLNGMVPPDGSGHILLQFQALPIQPWGAERQGNEVVLSTEENERQFAYIRKAGETAFQKDIALEDNTEYEVRMLYHNMHVASTATSFRAGVSLPEQEITMKKTQRIFCYVSSSQTGIVWASVELHTNDFPYDVTYVNGTAILHSHGQTDGMKLSSDLFGQGQYLGYDKLDGKLPAGDMSKGWIDFRIRTSCLKCRVKRSASLDGKSYVSGKIEVHPGDTVYIQTEFVNTGSREIQNATFKDRIPPGLSYVNGSATLKNAAHPNGMALKDLIHKNGFNTGKYLPGSRAIIQYQIHIPDQATGEFVTSSQVFHNEGMLKSSLAIRVKEGWSKDEFHEATKEQPLCNTLPICIKACI